jgi:hypothetical protein
LEIDYEKQDGKLQDEEPHNLFFSTNIIKVIKSRQLTWMGHVARMGEMRNSYEILLEETEWKRVLGKSA